MATDNFNEDEIDKMIRDEEEAQRQNSPSPSSSTGGNKIVTGLKGGRKVPFIWNAKRDLTLLKEVAKVLPFCAKGRSQKTAKWSLLAAEINTILLANVDNIALCRRFTLLIKEFKKDENANKYKSGIEEEITEIKTLLGDLLPMWETSLSDEEAVNCEKQKKVDNENKKAADIREIAMKTFSKEPDDNASDDVPKKKSTTWDKSVLELWERKIGTDQQTAIQKSKSKEEARLAEREEREKDRQVELRRLDLQEQQQQFQRDLLNQQEKARSEDSAERKMLLEMLVKQFKK